MKRKSRNCIVPILALAFLALSFQMVEAQSFPSKPVALVNPGGPGGSHDLTARAVTSVAAEYLGQPIIIKLMPGGGGSIGSEAVAKAAPDGYTLCWGGPGWSTTLPACEGTSRGPDDLVAVCRVNYSPGILLTKPNQPFKTFKEMLAWAKANPGKLSIGTTGTWGGADLAWKALVKQSGVDTKIVPYDGAEGLMALLGGHTDFAIYPSAPCLPHVKAGRLVALAVLDEKRHKDFPGVPTAKEEGFDLPYRMWRGALAPKGTPRPIIDKLAAAFKKMSEDPSVINMVKSFGDEAPLQYLGPDEFTKVWREEYETHKDICKFFKK
jgi:tripartite-type tricarboxylate transporter receptor subunit TctC